MTQPTDAALMQRVQSGDREAFGCLVDRHKDRLVNTLTRLTRSPERAEDLAQEAFLRLFERARHYREQGSFPAYLYRIAINLLRSQERRGRRWRVIAGMLSQNGHPEEPRAARRLLEREIQSEVARALAELPLRYRVPLVLREIEGWSYEEIARLTGCREGTLKSRLHRGRERLRERLRPYWTGEAS